MSDDPLNVELSRRLGYKRLSTAWGKLEILLGLTAAGVGLLLGVATLSSSRPDPWADPETVPLSLAALALFVLGAYLALAGHRSHLYRSMNDQLRILLEEIRRHREGDPHA